MRQDHSDPPLVFVGATTLEYGIILPSAQPSTEQPWLLEQHGAEHLVSLIILTMRVCKCDDVWDVNTNHPTVVDDDIVQGVPQGLNSFPWADTVRPTLTCVLLHTFSPTTLTLDLTELTPTFLTGMLLILVGSFLRVHCFHALGPCFMLQLSIHPTPVTDGVYGIIRHPSYTAIAAP